MECSGNRLSARFCGMSHSGRLQLYFEILEQLSRQKRSSSFWRWFGEKVGNFYNINTRKITLNPFTPFHQKKDTLLKPLMKFFLFFNSSKETNRSYKFFIVTFSPYFNCQSLSSKYQYGQWQMWTVGVVSRNWTRHFSFCLLTPRKSLGTFICGRGNVVFGPQNFFAAVINSVS